MKHQKIISRLLFCMVLLQAHGLYAAEITVAVAANFTPTMRELAQAFHEDSGHKVVIASGASGVLYAQIVNGAPFHLFLSADQAKPAALVDSGHALADSRYTYALGRLVLWSADPAMQVDNAEALRHTPNRRVAIANPRLAPYGLAANQVLDKLVAQGITRPMTVMGENITQAYQFADTGNADMGLVALSQVIEQGEIRRGAGWIIPANLYDPIRQDVVLLNSAQENSAAHALLKFLKGQAAQQIIKSYGYGVE